MKKTLTILSLIGATAMTTAQVGINNDTPDSTLDVVAGSDNTTSDVEGLLIPRVSKQKALNMAASAPEESTLIYINNLTDYTAPTDGSTDTEVEEITANGFYHWDGTQWVKHAGKDGMPWVYNGNSVELNQPNGFLNEVYEENSRAVSDKDLNTYSIYDLSDITNPTPLIKNVQDKLNENNYINREIYDFSRITLDAGEDIAFSNDKIYLVDNTISDQITDVRSENSSTTVDATNTKSYVRVAGMFSTANHHGRGVVNRLIAGAGIATSYPVSTVTSLEGFVGQASSYSNQASNEVFGLSGYASQRGDGEINRLIGVKSIVDSKTVFGTGNIGELIGFKTDQILRDTYTGNVENVIGLYIAQNFDPSLTNRIQNNYGIHINSITEGINKYAIYTNGGLNSFGDNLKIRNDKWINEQKAIFEFSNGASQKNNLPTSQIIDEMNGAGNGGSNLIFTTQNPTPGTNPNLTEPTEKLRIGADGKITVNDLTGTGERIVTADADGVLKTSTTIAQAFEDNSLFVADDSGNSRVIRPKDGYDTIIIEGVDEQAGGILAYSHTDAHPNAAGGYGTIRARGTEANPTGVLDGDNLGTFGAGGYDDQNLTYNSSAIFNFAEGDWSPTNHSSNITFATTNGTQRGYRMVIEAGGNVGIGTTTPSEKLEVAGNVKANSFIASQNTYPDYVFQNYYKGESNLNADYEFKSLDEVEAFIKENGHLPGYVSAKEVAEAGQFDMTATQLTNVEKIEELYLHLLEKEKEVKALKAELEAQNVRLEKLEQLLRK